MTELSFLIDLLLTEKMPVKIRCIIRDRIKEVEAQMAQASVPRSMPHPAQAPSTQRILDGAAAMNPVEPIPALPNTLAAAQALAARNEAVRIAASGIPEKGRTSPRKF